MKTSVTRHGHLYCSVLHSEQDNKRLDFQSLSRGAKSTPNRADSMLDGALSMSSTLVTAVLGLVRVSKYSFKMEKLAFTVSNQSNFSSGGKLTLE